MASRILPVPNPLSFRPLGFLPLLIILVFYRRYGWALAILIVAGLTDPMDGLLARRLNQKSSLGAYLDPIADKLLLSSSFVILAFKHKIGWWLAIIVLSRDVLILIVAVVILLVSGYRPFPPSIYGKATTATQIVLVFTVVLAAAYPNLKLGTFVRVLIYLVTVLSVVSSFHYSFTTARPPSGSAPEEK